MTIPTPGADHTSTAHRPDAVVLTGEALSITEVVAVARQGARVEVGDGVEARMAASRAIVERLDAAGEVAYGVTTGFGALADTVIGPADRAQLQRAVVLSHCAGIGAPLAAEVVRGMMLLRARTLAAGCSGVRLRLVEAIVDLLNAGIVPHVPEHGSLGASGDLATLAHAAACLLGEGSALRADADGGIEPAGTALRRAGLRELELGVKEGLALINGTDAMTATLVLTLIDLGDLLDAIDLVCAMSVEGLLGTDSAFAEEVIALRAAPGQQRSAALLRAAMAESPIVASHRHSQHAVQDAYALRCAPQVHGAARDLCAVALVTVERELASIVDNPLVLVDAGRLVSGGNFHGQALAYAADMLAAACADLAAISERRVDRLCDPARSRGLPAFLVPEPGVNSGLMIAQYTAAACVAALRAAAAPLAVQSASTSAGQEDHVSMGFEAALRTRRSVEQLRSVVAVEAVAAAQALELRAPLRSAPVTTALVRSLREVVAPLERDRFLGDDLGAAAAWLRAGSWRDAARAAGAPLEAR